MTADIRDTSGREPHVVVLREIEHGDHDRVAGLLVSSYDAAGPFDEEYLDYLGRPDEWVPGATSVLVAEDEGEVVGVVAFTLPGDDAFEAVRGRQVADAGFRFLAVDPRMRGRGVGRMLVRACLEAAARHGCRRAVVHSMSFMTAAHALYEQEGFVRRPDLDVRFPTGVGFGFHRDVAADAAEHFPPPGPAGDPPWYEDFYRD